MLIKLMVIGEIKFQALKSLKELYLKRLSFYCKMEIITLKEKVKKSIKENINLETKDIINKLDLYSDYEKILLDISGEQISSVNFSNIITNNQNYKNGKIVFIIGGSDGVNKNLFNKVNQVISFGSITFPHQLFQIILLEQIYRSFKIIKKEDYHK